MQTPFRVVHALIFLLSIFLSSAALSHGAANHDVVDNALTWLVKQQVNGAFTTPSSSANSWQASHEAVEALAVTKQLNNLDAQSIQHFFDAQAGQETELLARRIQVGLKLGLSVQNDLAELQ